MMLLELHPLRRPANASNFEPFKRDLTDMPSLGHTGEHHRTCTDRRTRIHFNVCVHAR